MIIRVAIARKRRNVPLFSFLLRSYGYPATVRAMSG